MADKVLFSAALAILKLDHHAENSALDLSSFYIDQPQVLTFSQMQINPIYRAIFVNLIGITRNGVTITSDALQYPDTESRNFSRPVPASVPKRDNPGLNTGLSAWLRSSRKGKGAGSTAIITQNRPENANFGYCWEMPHWLTFSLLKIHGF